MARLARRATVATLVLLATPALGCFGPFGKVLDPPRPETSLVCCDGYDQRDLRELIYADVAGTGRDEITINRGAYRVRVEAVAVGRRLNPEVTAALGLGETRPGLVAVDDDDELVAALVQVTAVAPAKPPSGRYVARVELTALADPDRLAGRNLVEQENRPPGATTVVYLAVVPKGSAVVMCDTPLGGSFDWLDVRTGRLMDKPANAAGCGLVER